MSERWMPKHGEIYYFVDSLFTVGSYAWRDVGTDAQYHKCGNCFRTAEEAEAAAEKVKALLLSLHYNGTSTANSETLKGTFTECLKKFAEHHADVILPKARERRLSEQYHNGPEETKLPDWCKIGEWVYLSNEEYDKIESIDGFGINLASGAIINKKYIHEEAVSARLRPYNADEIPNLPFEVSEINSDFRTIVVSCKGDKVWLGGASTAISTEELMRDFTIDGKPCGKLVHKEGDDWVE